MQQSKDNILGLSLKNHFSFSLHSQRTSYIKPIVKICGTVQQRFINNPARRNDRFGFTERLHSKHFGLVIGGTIDKTLLVIFSKTDIEATLRLIK